MPIYEYEADQPGDCPACAERFEVVEKFSDPPLAACPECGRPVQRVLSSPAIHGAQSSAAKLSNQSLGDKGFTKYVKAGDGHYEKVAGKGPRVIKR